jgi:hypothetical protein
MTLSQMHPQKTFIKPLKKPLKNSQKTLQKSTKNSQENQKVILFIKIIKISVDIAVRIGGGHSLGQLSNTVSL